MFLVPTVWFIVQKIIIILEHWQQNNIANVSGSKGKSTRSLIKASDKSQLCKLLQLSTLIPLHQKLQVICWLVIYTQQWYKSNQTK